MSDRVDDPKAPVPKVCDGQVDRPDQPDCAHHWPDTSGDPHFADWCAWCRLKYEIIIRPRAIF